MLPGKKTKKSRKVRSNGTHRTPDLGRTGKLGKLGKEKDETKGVDHREVVRRDAHVKAEEWLEAA